MSKENENNRYREEEKEEKENKEEVVEPEVVEESEIDKLKNEVKRINDLYLRTLAESENFKKRINDERIRERKYASQYFLENLVVPLDTFDKIVNIKTDDQNLNNFLIGFKMINDEVNKVLEGEGVKKIKTVGEKFNPSYHHAVETVWDETKEEDVIISELQGGYMYKDRVLRAALVKVNKKIENKEEK